MLYKYYASQKTENSCGYYMYIVVSTIKVTQHAA